MTTPEDYEKKLAQIHEDAARELREYERRITALAQAQAAQLTHQDLEQAEIAQQQIREVWKIAEQLIERIMQPSVHEIAARKRYEKFMNR